MTAIPDQTPPFTEDAVSQLPALHLLQKLGWELMPPADVTRLRSGKKGEVVLRSILERQLAVINDFSYRGRSYRFDRSAIEEGIRALTNLGDEGLIRTNERVWELLRFGKGVPQTVDGDTKSFQLKFLDWEHPERNVFHVSDEFAVESSGATDTRRVDIMLFVNGIPLAAVECKRPGDVGGEDPLEQAIAQQLRNQREQEVPRLFHYAQVLFALAMNQAKYGATGTPSPFWQGWQEQQLPEAELLELLKTPLTQEEAGRTFASDPHRFRGTTAAVARAWLDGVVASGRLPNEQDRLLWAVARPERLLALSSRYTVFEGGARKVARYQQYFTVEDIMTRVRGRDETGARRGGLVWHTQGSGKSLTMVMLAEALLAEFASGRPRVVLVTDRVDLDDQIYGTFIASGVATSQAKTGRHLLDLLGGSRTQVVTTLLQKFESAVNARDTVIDSSEIFVLVDEGHRSQTGQFHAAMRRVLPRACFIGFTGTPVFTSQVPTIERFGGLIGTPYTIDQAVKDKAVVPLLYEGRHVHQRVDQLPIDQWFKKYTGGLTEEQRADLKRKYSSADQLNRTEQKVRAIAWDVSEHFQTNFKGTGFKGQLVTPSKATALQYKRFMDEFGMASTEVLISPPDTSEGQEDETGAKAAVGRFWQDMMRRYGNEARYQKDLTARFKSAEAPEIIIVVDKLLTGFDAPRNAVLYLTRSLKDHKLLQAIARVNRVSEGKDFGLIVDYYGVLDHLDEAIDQYTGEATGELMAHLYDVLRPLERAAGELPQRHSDLWDVFKTVAHKNDQEAMERHLADEPQRFQFYERLAAFAKTLRLALASVSFHENTDPDLIDRYRRDLRYFMQLRASVARRYAETVDFKQYQGPIQKLLDTYVGADEVETLVQPVSILDKDAFAKELATVSDPRAKAEIIANRVRRAIHEHVEEDPVFYKRFSELIDKALADARADRISQLELLTLMEDIRDRVRDRRAYEDVPAVLKNRDVAKSYYDVLRDEAEAAGLSLPDGEAAQFAALVDDTIRARRKVDWTDDVDVQNQMKIAIEDELFAFNKAHGIEMGFDTIDRVLDRVIDVARRRVP